MHVCVCVGQLIFPTTVCVIQARKRAKALPDTKTLPAAFFTAVLKLSFFPLARSTSTVAVNSSPTCC